MNNLIESIKNMDKTYEFANGSAHFQGKKADMELMKEFKALSNEEKKIVLDTFKDVLDTELRYTYVGDSISRFSKE